MTSKIIYFSFLILILIFSTYFVCGTCLNNRSLFCSVEENTSKNVSELFNITKTNISTHVSNISSGFYTKTNTKKQKEITLLSIIISGIILGLLDGIINPCVLSLIIILITFLFSLGSRKRVIKCGIAFVLGAAVAYAFYVFLILIAIQYLLFTYKYYVIISLASILLILGILEIKEFFFYGKGISLKIPDFAKGKLEKLMKKATIMSSIIFGALSSLVNLGCTGGFPTAYAMLLNQTPYSLLLKAIFVIWYDIWFATPLILIVVGFYYGFIAIEKLEKIYKTKKHIMRLIAGIALISLAIYFLLPVFLSSITEIKAAPITIFYSSTCPHCHELFEDLEKLNVSPKLYCKICVDSPKGMKLWEKICEKFNSTPLGTPTVYVKLGNTEYLFVGYTRTINAKLCKKYGLVCVKIFNCTTCYDPKYHCYILTREILIKLISECKKVEKNVLG